MFSSVRVRIPSDLREVSLVGQLVRSVSSHQGLADSTVREMELCIVEAVNNAIVHAYGNESGHFVAVTLTLKPDSLVFEVRDEGLSLDPAVLRAKPFPGADSVNSMEPKSLPESGWGLAIIRAVMDRVDYRASRGVNRLVLTKHL